MAAKLFAFTRVFRTAPLVEPLNIESQKAMKKCPLLEVNAGPLSVVLQTEDFVLEFPCEAGCLTSPEHGLLVGAGARIRRRASSHDRKRAAH